MASGSNYLTTYYAKRIIGDSAAETATKALLQTGTGITNDIWILHRTNRVNLYGIKYMYDDTTNGTADRIELYGGHQVSSVDTATAWVQLDTGDVYILGRVGINYDPSDNNNTYSLYVNGTTYVYGTTYLNDAVGIGYDPETGGNTYKLYVNGDIYGDNNFYLNGKMGIGYNPATSGNTYKLYVDGDTYFDDNTYLNGKVGIGYNPNTSGNAYKLYVNGTSYFNGNTTHNGIDYFANGTTYYINNSADSYLRDVKVRSLGIAQTDGTTGYGISLYDGPQTSAPTYGIMFAKTATYGTHGAVTSDWATYLTMSDTTNRGWIFRRGSTNVVSIDGTGKIYLGYATNANNPGIYWNPYVESASDASDVSRIIQVKSGVAGGTELQIYQANDATDVINLVTPAYIYMNSKRAFIVSDSWLRINEDLGFSSGIYTGSSLIRSDNQLQVGSNGSAFYANSSGDGKFNRYLTVNNRIYAKEWIQFDNWTGLYSPNNSAHFYPNNVSSYGTWTINGSRNGYYGINLGPGTGYMTLMCDGSGNGGLFCEGDRWPLYYYKSGGRLGLMNSSTSSGYSVQVNGSLYVTSTTQIAGTTYLASTVYINWPNSINVRHINGCNWNASNKDLYLQYQQNAPIYLGNSAAYYISADGSYYSGNTPTNMNGTNRTMQIRYGGVTLQYGQHTTVTFSPAFSNACLMVAPINQQEGFGAGQAISVDSYSKTSCRMYNYNTSNAACWCGYIAIGY